MVTFASLEEQLRYKLKDGSADTLARITYALNDTIKDIYNSANWYFSVDYASNSVVGAGTREVTLNSTTYADLDSIVDLKVGLTAGGAEAAKSLLPVSARSVFEATTATIPTTYALTAPFTIQFNAILGATYTAWFSYKKKLADYSQGEGEIVIPGNWSHVIIQGAYARLLVDEDDTRAVAEDVKYQNLLTQMKIVFGVADDTMTLGADGTFGYFYKTAASMTKDNSSGNLIRAKIATNNAYREFCNAHNWTFLLNTGGSITGTGARSYTIDTVTVTDFGTIQSVGIGSTFDTAEQLSKLDWASTATESEETDISGYSIFENNKIRFTSALPTGSFAKYSYLKKIATLNADTDPVLIPVSYSDILVQGAYAQLLKINKDKNYAIEDGKFQSMIAKLKRSYGFSMDFQPTMGAL